MSPRARQACLAAAAASSVVTGHALDAFGLLPGVSESEAVRAAVLAPRYEVVTVVGAVVLALVAEHLLRVRRPLPALVTLIAGQLALLGAPELLGRKEAGEGGEEWGALVVAVGLQVVLATAAVVTVLLVEALLPWALLAPASLSLPPHPRLVVGVSPLPSGRTPLAVRTRGPPVLVVP
jgi:hypothetical protein